MTSSSPIRRMLIAMLAAAPLSASGSIAEAQLSLPGLGRSDPVDPFQSRPGMSPPGNVPGTPTQMPATERLVQPRDTYVAQREPVSERRNYDAMDREPPRYAAPQQPSPQQPPYRDAAGTPAKTDRPAPPNSPVRREPEHDFGETPDPLLAAQPVARVGPEVILVADVLGPVNQQLASKLRDGSLQPQEIDREREKLIRLAVNNLIDQKLVMTVARRDLPPEALPKIEQSINEQFDKTQLKNLYEQTNTKTKTELDERLKQGGTSLARQRRLFFEKSVTQEWIRREVNVDPEVTHDDMLAYYRLHADEFAIKGQSRWEELMVRFDEFPTKAAAWAAVADMGNRVMTRQTPFAQVARESSQGATASNGGARDWTSRGSHASKELDEALFTLPVGRMSRIIEGPTGFHIVRVVERKEDSMRSFVEAQVEIREKIKKQKTDTQVKEYLAKLRANTPVWTIFDGPPKELAEAGEAGRPLR